MFANSKKTPVCHANFRSWTFTWIIGTTMLGIALTIGMLNSCSDLGENDRALKLAHERVGVDLAEYGAVVVADYSSEIGEEYADIELKCSSSSKVEELESRISEVFGVIDLTCQSLPMMSGQKMARDIEAMRIDAAYSHAVEGKRVKTINLYLIFATARDGQYLFYIG